MVDNSSLSDRPKKLFVCTVNLNNYEGLKRTINSYRLIPGKVSLTPIIVDGCSSDKSVEYIKSLPSIYIKIIEKDKGIYDAMNKAIYYAYDKKSDAEDNFIIFMNSGDEFDEGIKGAFNYNLSFPINVFRNREDNGSISPRFSGKLLKFGFMPFCHQAIIYNINQIPLNHMLYESDLKSYGDYRQLNILNQKMYLCNYFDDIIAIYEQITTTGLSRSNWKFRIEKLKIVFNLYGLFGIIRVFYFRIFRKMYFIRYQI